MSTQWVGVDISQLSTDKLWEMTDEIEARMIRVTGSYEWYNLSWETQQVSEFLHLCSLEIGERMDRVRLTG